MSRILKIVLGVSVIALIFAASLGWAQPGANSPGGAAEGVQQQEMTYQVNNSEENRAYGEREYGERRREGPYSEKRQQRGPRRGENRGDRSEGYEHHRGWHGACPAWNR